MNLYRFIATVKHDDGMIDIHAMATDAQAARRIIMTTEGCPERSIRRLRAVSDDGYELRADKPGSYRRLAVAEVRQSCWKNGQCRPDKVPMPYEVRVLDEARWRRVYGTRHSGARYAMIDGLKVMIDLPKELP